MRLLALALCQLILWGLTQVANYYLAPLHVYLVLGGLHLAYAALVLPPGLAFAVAFFAGLLLDAATPVAFGLHAWIFALCTMVLLLARPRLAREETSLQIGIALLVNFLLFVLLSSIHLHGTPSISTTLGRLAWDLWWSQVATALVAGWFSALQARALALASPAFLHRREERL